MNIGRFAKEGWRFNPVLVLAALAGLLLRRVWALAHHGEAALTDAAKTLSLQGTMTGFEWGQSTLPAPF